MIDYEEMMLQVSGVMRQANRVRPTMSHEEAINAIREIVAPKGKWGLFYECPRCGELKRSYSDQCPFCGTDMRGDT